MADSYMVELLSILVGVLAFFGGFFLQEVGKPASIETSTGLRLALSMIIGLLSATLTEQFIERATVRSRRGRLELIEDGLMDRNVYEYVHIVVNSYRDAVSRRGDSAHPDLYDEIVSGLFDGADWKNLSEGKLEIRDATREMLIAQDLLPTAEKMLRAVALPDDLDYLESGAGRDWLEAQRERISGSYRRGRAKFEIRRLFVVSERSAQTLNTNKIELRQRIDAVAADHVAAKIECKIVDLDEVDRIDFVPDMNIYDDHTVRRATIQLGDGRMQSIVSEDPSDVRTHSRMFESLWAVAERYGVAPPNGVAAPANAPGVT